MKPKRTVRIGVLLERGPDREVMRKLLSHDTTPDFIIEPKSLDDFLNYLAALPERGIQVDSLILVGHGSPVATHIGMLDPGDVDLVTKQTRHRWFKEELAKARKTMRACEEKLRISRTKEHIDALEDARDACFNLEINLGVLEKELIRMDAIGNVMAPGGTIGIFNCFGASPWGGGRRMMNYLGKLFLERRGGRVIGINGLILIDQPRPFISWMTGQEDIIAHKIGRVEEHLVSPSRCGAACADFKRYGYCDHPADPVTGSCWQHQGTVKQPQAEMVLEEIEN